MLPTREEALNELNIANEMNPGPWREHSLNVADAAKRIAEACHLDANKAYVLGLLHDIGRRTGIAQVRHIIDGYDFCISKGWDEVARCCLTHSFPIKDIEADISKKDITKEQYDFIKKYLDELEYDEYDKLIILCDSLADAKGFCILEKRFVDTTRRYGVFSFTIDRWNYTFEYKKYFDILANMSIYNLLPGIEECIFD
ncbi:MAG: HD domain-containing protein [Clostridiales bacterium]|nr:HD domain-containing protein [Clostridiales bacterium]